MSPERMSSKDFNIISDGTILGEPRAHQHDKGIMDVESPSSTIVLNMFVLHEKMYICKAM